MKVYLIRHAQSEENALDMRARVSPHDYNEVVRRSHASPLTERGRQQAAEVVARLEQAGVERLYASPMLRALSTATIIGESLGLEPQVLEALQEVMPPEMPAQARARSLRRFFVRSYIAMAWPRTAGESWGRAYARARAAWQLLSEGPHDVVAAVSHRGLITLMLLSLRRDRRWHVLSRDLSNGGVSLIVWRG